MKLLFCFIELLLLFALSDLTLLLCLSRSNYIQILTHLIRVQYIFKSAIKVCLHINPILASISLLLMAFFFRVLILRDFLFFLIVECHIKLTQLFIKLNLLLFINLWSNLRFPLNSFWMLLKLISLILVLHIRFSLLF